MRVYLAHIVLNLKLTLRDRLVLFFNYVFPLVFFFIFAQAFGASRGGAFVQTVSMVLIIGVLGNGFFGAGIRAIQERELNILRRYRVAPITAAPLLVASMVTGWANYLPMAVVVLALSRCLYGMPLPSNWLSLAVFLSIGIIAFRSIGLMIASVVNSAQEGQIIIQLFYFPMLFLSGATLPLEFLPKWVQAVAQFLPASHLFLGIQGILIRGENLLDVWRAAAALIVTTIAATFLSVKLFRWEKEERISGAAKLWLAAALLPFLALGAWELRTQHNLAKVKSLTRETRRSQVFLVRDARLFNERGDAGTGSVLLRKGKIERIWQGAAPSARELKAESIDASGKTLLPALIDGGIHLDQSGAFPDSPSPRGEGATRRHLAAYVYCGVAAVRPAAPDLRAAARVASGEWLGAELLDGSPAAYSSAERIPDEIFARLAAEGTPFAPALAAAEAADAVRERNAELLEPSLVQQVAPPLLIEALKKRLAAAPLSPPHPRRLDIASDNLRRAWKAGVRLVAASQSGLPLLLHGPTLHRELHLWVKAGIPPRAALEAATSGNARWLGAGSRLGQLAPGYEATLLLVNGNPLNEIDSTQHIAAVFIKGERVIRAELFEEE